MPLTVAEITEELEGLNYPCFLDYASGVVASALRELNRYYPIVAYGSFLTTADEQDYLIFDTANAVTSGFAEDALAIKNIYWNPGRDWSSLNIFSPGWQMLSQQIIFTGSYFHHPSLMVGLQQKLNAWAENFGNQGFEVVGPVGAATSILRVTPVPRETGSMIFVEFSKGWALTDINEAARPYLMQWVRYFAAESAANKYSQSAGIELLGFKDSTSAVTYWRDKAKELRQVALDTQSGTNRGIVARS